MHPRHRGLYHSRGERNLRVAPETRLNRSNPGSKVFIGRLRCQIYPSQVDRAPPRACSVSGFVFSIAGRCATWKRCLLPGSESRHKSRSDHTETAEEATPGRASQAQRRRSILASKAPQSCCNSVGCHRLEPDRLLPNITQPPFASGCVATSN